ncbi:MAG TPA: Ig-like domain-containing protein, partial [Myxococcota bacterium]
MAASADAPSPPQTRELIAGHKPYVRPRPLMLSIPTETARAAGGVQSIPERDRLSTNALFTKGGAPLPVYLERHQITYSGGADNSSQNVSSVVGSGSATVGAWPGSDADWNATKACIQQQFAAFNVTVTDVEPSGGEYVEAHMGGTPQQVGLPDGVGGVAPIDNFSCNIIPRAVVYIFSGVLGNDNELNCEVAAQEISHAFSLDHEFLCQDPMTYLSGCGDKRFQDQDVSCGEFQPRQCNCGRPSQNSVQLITDKIGSSGPVVPTDPSDTTPPVVTLTNPANGSTLQGDTNITVTATVSDAGSIASTDLLWNFSGDVFPCPGQSGGGAVNCTVSGNTRTWTITVGEGDRTFSVRASDGGNNTTTTAERTIHLTADGTPQAPPTGGDVTAPVVSMVSPNDGATLTANSTIEVSASATDDSGSLAAVELLWTFSGDTFPCPLQQGNVTCVKTGDTYTWSLSVGVGSRAFQVRATDLSGNQALTPERSITLTTDPLPPDPTGGTDVAEPNDDAGHAFGTRCGTAIDVAATPGNDDWFTVEAPAGTDVQVGLAATAGSPLALTLFSTDGTTVLESTTDALTAGALTATSGGPNVLAKVTTSGSAEIAYRLSVTCGNGDTPPPPTTDDAFEANNTIETATRSFCGQERDNMVALDDDIFVVAVRPQDTLHVKVRSDGAEASILQKDGTELAAAGNDIIAASLAGGDVYVKVDPTGAGAVYDVSFACDTTASPQVNAAG